MIADAADTYRARFRKVLDYIDANLDEELTAERLSHVAAFSKYHFHRQFSELFGMSVYKCVQLIRLKRAAWQLAFREHSQIIDIALASGYENPESFARAFRNSLGQSPSEFRKQPQWAPWYAIYQPMSLLRGSYMKPHSQSRQVSLITCKATQVALLMHRGDPTLIGDSVRKFIQWRKQNHLPPRISATFNILYDDPATTPPDNFRHGLCVATTGEVTKNTFGVTSTSIPGGRCAVLRHVGSDDTLGESFAYLYSTWLPQSAEEPRDFPLYLQRVSFFPDVPEHQAITDIFLPLR